MVGITRSKVICCPVSMLPHVATINVTTRYEAIHGSKILHEVLQVVQQVLCSKCCAASVVQQVLCSKCCAASVAQKMKRPMLLTAKIHGHFFREKTKQFYNS